VSARTIGAAAAATGFTAKAVRLYEAQHTWASLNAGPHVAENHAGNARAPVSVLPATIVPVTPDLHRNGGASCDAHRPGRQHRHRLILLSTAYGLPRGGGTPVRRRPHDLAGRPAPTGLRAREVWVGSLL
jgi:hypothetical protein